MLALGIHLAYISNKPPRALIIQSGKEILAYKDIIFAKAGGYIRTNMYVDIKTIGVTSKILLHVLLRTQTFLFGLCLDSP